MFTLIPLIGPTTIALAVLSPVYGWAASRSVAHYAGGRTVPPVLLAAGAVLLALWSGWRAPGVLLTSTLLGWTLLLLGGIDALSYRLPDVITLPLAAVGLFAPGAPAGEGERLFGALIGFGALWALEQLYRRLRGRSGMGLGDAKLLAAAGAWLGAGRLGEVLALACAGGLAWVAVRVVHTGRGALARPLPFGAPLCAAFWLVWLKG